MEPAQQIRDALSRVAGLRQAAAIQPGLAQALTRVKQLQAERFAGTYPDLLADKRYAPSARFFLDELYSERDYSDRDAQFSRIAPALERTFPAPLVATAVALAQLHQQTEELDLAMAHAAQGGASAEPVSAYVSAWRIVGQRAQRLQQLATVLDIGQTLTRLTRKPGLRLMLKMMRQPARLAGLGSLQRFLESGFDHFAGMAAQRDTVDTFLSTIQKRESDWIACLFESTPEACESRMEQTLGLARTIATAPP